MKISEVAKAFVMCADTATVKQDLASLCIAFTSITNIPVTVQNLLAVAQQNTSNTADCRQSVWTTLFIAASQQKPCEDCATRPSIDAAINHATDVVAHFASLAAESTFVNVAIDTALADADAARHRISELSIAAAAPCKSCESYKATIASLTQTASDDSGVDEPIPRSPL
jgi:hypothetical protein